MVSPDKAHSRLELRILRTYDTPASSGGRDAAEKWAQWEAGAATRRAGRVFPAQFPLLRRGHHSRRSRRAAAAAWLLEPPSFSRCRVRSAAPTIFPPFCRADGSKFIDGALSGYNNPSLLVLTEGLDLAAGRPVDLMLSLGAWPRPRDGPRRRWVRGETRAKMRAKMFRDAV